MSSSSRFNIDFENGRETGQDEARDQVVKYLVWRRNYLIERWGARNEEAKVWLLDSLIRAINDDQHWSVEEQDDERSVS